MNPLDTPNKNIPARLDLTRYTTDLEYQNFALERILRATQADTFEAWQQGRGGPCAAATGPILASAQPPAAPIKRKPLALPKAVPQNSVDIPAAPQPQLQPAVESDPNIKRTIVLEPMHEVFGRRQLENITGLNWPQTLTSAHETFFVAARIAGATRAKSVGEYLSEQKAVWGFEPSDLTVNALYHRAVANMQASTCVSRLEGFYAALALASEFVQQAMTGMENAGQRGPARDLCVRAFGLFGRLADKKRENVTAEKLAECLAMPGFAGALHTTLQANIHDPVAVRMTLILARGGMVDVVGSELRRMSELSNVTAEQVNDTVQFLMEPMSDVTRPPRIIPASWDDVQQAAIQALLKANPALQNPATIHSTTDDVRRSIGYMGVLLLEKEGDAAGPYFRRLVNTWGNALTSAEKAFYALYLLGNERSREALTLLPPDEITLPRLAAMIDCDQQEEANALLTPEVIARSPLLAMLAMNKEDDARMALLYSRVAVLSVPKNNGADAAKSDELRGNVAAPLARVDDRTERAWFVELLNESWARPTNSKEQAIRYLLAFAECGGDEIAATHLSRICPRSATQPTGRAVRSTQRPEPVTRPLSAARKAWFRENLEKPFLGRTVAYVGDGGLYMNSVMQSYQGRGNQMVLDTRREAEAKLAEETGVISLLARSEFKDPRWPTYTAHMADLGLSRQRYEATTRHVESLRLAAKKKGIFGSGASNDAIPQVANYINAENKRLIDDGIAVQWRFHELLRIAKFYEISLVDVMAYRAQQRAIHE